MKKSKIVSLVLITSALASCSQKQNQKEKKVYMRSDSTAKYSRSHGAPGLWYYAFRPYGYYTEGSYHRAGFYSSGISEKSNLGTNSFKTHGPSGTSRGGFGRSSSFTIHS